MAGNQGLHSAENGKNGGRPPSTATLITQTNRELTIKWCAEHLQEGLEALLTKVRMGDIQAIKEFLERALGKSSSVLGDDDGELIRAVALKFIECGHNTRSTTTGETTDPV